MEVPSFLWSKESPRFVVSKRQACTLVVLQSRSVPMMLWKAQIFVRITNL